MAVLLATCLVLLGLCFWLHVQRSFEHAANVRLLRRIEELQEELAREQGSWVYHPAKPEDMSYLL